MRGQGPTRKRYNDGGNGTNLEDLQATSPPPKPGNKRRNYRTNKVQKQPKRNVRSRNHLCFAGPTTFYLTPSFSPLAVLYCRANTYGNRRVRFTFQGSLTRGVSGAPTRARLVTAAASDAGECGACWTATPRDRQRLRRSRLHLRVAERHRSTQLPGLDAGRAARNDV